MKRESAESSPGRMRPGFVGWLASSVVVIAICGTAAAQDDGSKPPDLIPLPSFGGSRNHVEIPDSPAHKSDAAKNPNVVSYFEHPHDFDLAATTAGAEAEKQRKLVSYFKRPHDFRPAETTAEPASRAPTAPKPPVESPEERRRKVQAAISYRDREIAAHPDLAESYFQRAALRAEVVPRQDIAAGCQVLADLDEALRRDPNHLEALALRGYLRVEIGDDQGIADTERVLEQSPRHLLANYTRAVAYCLDKDFDAALEHLGRVVNGSGNLALRVNSLRAQCLAGLGRYPAAIDSLNEAMASYACDAEMYLLRATWYHELGARESARADVTEYIRLRENNLDSRVRANLAMLQMGEPGFVYLDAESLRRDHPNDPFPYILRFAARYIDSCRRDRVLRRVEAIAGWAEAFLPLQPIASMVRTSSHAVTGLGRELAFKDMEHGLDLIGQLCFPYACGALANACDGRLVPTCRDLVMAAVRFDPRHFQFGLRFDKMQHQWFFTFKEAERWDVDPGKQRDYSSVVQIIGLALDYVTEPAN